MARQEAICTHTKLSVTFPRIFAFSSSSTSRSNPISNLTGLFSSFSFATPFIAIPLPLPFIPLLASIPSKEAAFLFLFFLRFLRLLLEDDEPALDEISESSWPAPSCRGREKRGASLLGLLMPLWLERGVGGCCCCCDFGADLVVVLLLDIVSEGCTRFSGKKN